MKLYCGTSGFSFKEWKGPFYPKNLPANKMLAFYAEHLPTVEINNTFYRMPRRSLLEGWAAQVPDTFRFAIKAPRRITHMKQLLDCKEEAGYRSVRNAFTFFCMRQRKRLKRRSAPRVFPDPWIVEPEIVVKIPTARRLVVTFVISSSQSTL